MKDLLIHKETFRQPAHDGVPASIVVQYWVDDPNGFPEDKHFTGGDAFDRARDFVDGMIEYEDWLGSQEEPLATQ